MEDAVYGHAMIREVDRHDERQNHNQRCRHRRPVTFDGAVRSEHDRSSERCDATCRDVKCRMQWFHWRTIDISLRRQ